MIIIAPYNDYNFSSRKFENKNDDNSNHINLSGGDQYLEDILNFCNHLLIQSRNGFQLKNNHKGRRIKHGYICYPASP